MKNFIGPIARRWLLGMLPVIGVIILWWAITAFFFTQGRIYPPPYDVAKEILRILTNSGGPLGPPLGHALATLSRLLIAWAIAFVSGTLLGVIAGRIKWFFDFSNSFVWIAMAVPSVVWVFIFLVILGISNIVPIAALVLLLGAPVFIGTAEGIRATPADLVEMSESYKVGRFQRLIGLYLPSAAPYMVSNARVSFSLGIKIVLIAEVVGLPNGIGLLVRYWSDSLFMTPIVAWGLILVVVGMIINRVVFVPLERWVRR